MPTTLTTLTTLGDLIDHRHTLSAWCRSCQRGAMLDLPALAARLGRERSYLGPLPISCSRCGSRDVAVSLHGPGR
jgi:hypothetical protein